MSSIRQFANVPCAKCARDTLHISNTCHQCGTHLPLTPRDPVHDFDPTVSHGRRDAAREARAKARRAYVKARQAKVKHPPAMTYGAIATRKHREKQRAMAAQQAGV
jgi:hypothetical protein